MLTHGRPSIAAKIGSRTGKQCRERYINHLSPHIKHGPWTDEEDEIMYKLHAELGSKWVQYMERLPGNNNDAHEKHEDFVFMSIIDDKHEDDCHYYHHIVIHVE